MSSTHFCAALCSRPFLTESYESLPINSTIPAETTLNVITYVNFPVYTEGQIYYLFCRIGDASLSLQRGGNNTSFLPKESFSVAFTVPVFAVWIFFNVAISPRDSLFIKTPVGTATTGGPTYDQGTLYFSDLISDTPFTTATFCGDSDIGSGFTVDNLTFAPTRSPSRRHQSAKLPLSK